MVNQLTEEVAVQVSVPEPLFVTMTAWLGGFTPFCTAENDSKAGFRAMIGVDRGGGGDIGGGVADGVAGVRS